MGFFDSDTEPSQSEQLMNQQIQENRAELARKKQDLYQTRLDIIKGQGGQNWNPEPQTPAPRRRGGGGMGMSGGGNFAAAWGMANSMIGRAQAQQGARGVIKR